MALIVLIALLTAAALHAAPFKEDIVVFRDPTKYSCFPGIRKAADSDELWVNFGWNTTRSHYGKAAGGKTGGKVFYSPDGGKTWIEQGQEGYKERPAWQSYHELSDGTRIFAWARGHEIMDEAKAKELAARGINVVDHHNGNWTACYRAFAKQSTDGGKTWQSRELKLPPLAFLMGSSAPRGVKLPDDTVVIPCYGAASKDDPAGRAYVLRSGDKGRTWELITAAYDGRHSLNEGDLIVAGGRIVGLWRSEGGKAAAPPYELGFLYQTESSDEGKTWSRPRRLPIWGYPPDLLRLKNGAILVSYGYRRPPYGIRACFSRDEGRTWDWKHEVILRDDALPEGPQAAHASVGDLGYPHTVELSDGTLVTAYYITLGDGVTHICVTRWSPDYLGPKELRRGVDAVPPPDPSLPPEHIVGDVGPLRLRYGVHQSFLPTADKISQIAVRIGSGSEKYEHTYGMYVALRMPNGNQWWTKFIGQSEKKKPDEIKVNGWNAFRFDPPVKVEPGKLYVMTVYNLDYIGGVPGTPLKEGLTGEHFWRLNSGLGYPNGGIGPGSETDIAFKVYAEPGPLPED